MPLFIIISGYFYRPNKFDRVIQLLAVFLIWQVINGVFSKLIQDRELVSLHADSRMLDLFDPYWTMWFLLGIIVWTIITPYVLRLRYPLLITIALAVWVSYVNDVPSWFSFRKLVNFYPYFLIGYLLKDKNIIPTLALKAKTWKQPVRWASLISIIAFLAFMVFFTKNNWDTAITFMRDSYSYFHWSFVKGAAVQIAIYGLVTIVSVSLMLVIPQERKLIFFNKIGIYSIFIYLVHTNIVRVYRGLLPEQIANNQILLMLIAAVFAVFTCWLITRKFMLTLFRPFVEPKMEWSFRSTKQQSAINKKEVAS